MRILRNLLFGFTLVAAVAVLINNQYLPVPTQTLMSTAIVLSDDSVQKIKLSGTEAQLYHIDVLLLQKFKRSKMKRILGDNTSGDRGELRLNWKLLQQATVIQQGSSSKYALAPIFTGNGQWGLTIGVLRLLPGVDYTLEVEVIDGQAEWDSTSPILELNLPPAALLAFKTKQQRLYLLAAGLLLLGLAGMFLFRERN